MDSRSRSWAIRVVRVAGAFRFPLLRQTGRCLGFQHARDLRPDESSDYELCEQSRRSHGVLPGRCGSGWRWAPEDHRWKRVQRRQWPRRDQGREWLVLHGRKRQQRQPVQEATDDHSDRRRLINATGAETLEPGGAPPMPPNIGMIGRFCSAATSRGKTPTSAA